VIPVARRFASVGVGPGAAHPRRPESEEAGVKGYRFGPVAVAGGGTEFRLWAPGHRRVELILDSPRGARRCLSLRPEADGFFSVRVPEAGPGWRYRYRVDGRGPWPDPASRRQPEDVHGPSELVVGDYPWTDGAWRGLDWSQAVIYELHVGTFTPEGTFDAVIDRLDHLAALGVNALELMPVADFPGRCNWGYDGTFLFAPDSAYGPPDSLKRLVDACHGRGMAVILDVVYNHLGPDGNYLWPISPPFFNQDVHTPWGASIAIEHPLVARFFEENARFWIEEYHFDGLRLDAVHALDHWHRPRFLAGLARAARGAAPDRPLFLVLENVDNQAEYLRDAGAEAYDAQWNDDFHHALHALLTGERSGVYQEHDVPARTLARVLAQGFAYQGEYSPWRQRPRGTSTRGLSLDRFVNFLQTHDMAGNRAFGERLHQLIDADRYRAVVALYLFLPGIPMLFMGEEFAASTPFLFFTDHTPELGEQVRAGRLRQHQRSDEPRAQLHPDRIPHPQDHSTFTASKLDWDDLERHRETLSLYARAIEHRRAFLPTVDQRQEGIEVASEGMCFTVILRDLRGRDVVACLANLGDQAYAIPGRLGEDGSWAEVLATREAPAGMVAGHSTLWLAKG